MLGPLCVALTVFEVPQSSDHAESLPDMWTALSGAVCREAKQAGPSRIAVNDSKALKGANSLKTRHPLAHLERGVLGFMQSMSSEAIPPESDSELIGALGAKTPGDIAPEWYAGEDLLLPVSTNSDHIRVIGGRLRTHCERSGVRLLDLSVRMLDERAFNERLSRTTSKAEVSFSLVGSLIRRVWRSRCALHDAGVGTPVVVVDRQSGRMRYADSLRVAAPEATILVVREDEEESTYEVSAIDPDSRKRRIRVCFRVEAEAHHLPVALASMTAKYVRELAMMRFNRYWCGRYAELKPTAGYFTDARRWLKDLRTLSGLPEASLHELCRRA